jgi:hypothetical protein
MVLNRFNSGPQIHFWISEKVVSETEQQQTVVDEGDGAQSLECCQQEDCQKERCIPPYYHVEIF